MSKFDDRYTDGQVIIDDHAPGVAVVTLWRKREQIAARLPPGLVAAIGNLYSQSEGLERLVRSLFANPFIHTLIILTSSNDLSGSEHALRRFMDNGVAVGQDVYGRSRLLVIGAESASISPELPIAALDELRGRLRVVYIDRVETLAETAMSYGQPPEGYVPPEAVHYPADPEPETDYWPGSVNGHVVSGRTISEVWVELLSQIMRHGQSVPNANYGTGTRELIVAMSVINGEDPGQPHLPDWMSLSQDDIKRYVTSLLTGVPEPGASYTYGQRMAEHDQIAGLIDKLAVDPTQRGALIELWKPAVDLRGNGSPPCLIAVWARLVVGRSGQTELHLAATFRSHDIFKAYPLNLFGLLGLQEHIRLELSRRLNTAIKRGPLICTSWSAHVYAQDWPIVQQLVTDHRRVDKPGSDPNGNYRVEGQGDSLTLTQLDPDNNQPLRRWNDTADELIKTVVREMLTSQPGHLAWLVSELRRCQSAI